jgi:hypothetical protein
MVSDEFKILDDAFVSIIILNYNGENIILECIESIFNTEKCKFEVIVIDNGSNDNSHFRCKQKFPEITLIENKENMGMSARNIGITNSKGNYIIFLDYDTIVKPNWLIQFIKSHIKHGEGLYQPKFLEKERPNIINSAGNMINVFGLPFLQGRGEIDSGQYDDFKNISYTGGACTFASRDTIKKIGDVDAIFFAYHDDLDYGWRGLLLKVPSFYEPNVIVYHYGSPTLKWSKKKFFLLERNRWICLLTLYSMQTLFKILPLLIIVEIGMLIFFLSKKMGMVKIKTFFSLLKMIKEIEKRHKQIKMHRKISDKEVIHNFTDNFNLPISANTKTSYLVDLIIPILSKTARKIISF